MTAGPSHAKGSRFLYPLIILSSMGFAQGMIVAGFLSTALNQLEKQFHFSSLQSGLIHSAYDFCFGVSAIISGILGSTKKMSLVCFGCLIMGVGTFIFIIPNFLYTPPRVYHIATKLCNLNSSTTKIVGEKIRSSLTAFLILSLGYGIVGVGASFLHTLGPPYMHENLKSTVSAWYLSVFYSICSLGPAAGFFVMSAFVSIPFDLDFNTGISPSSEIWIGAWWIGYLMCGLYLVALYIITLAVPIIFKSYKYYYTDSCTSIIDEPQIQATTKRLPITVNRFLRLVQNKSYLFLIAAQCMDGFVSSGVGTFFSKFIEVQYHVSPSKAGILTGSMLIFGGVGAQLTGGYIVKRFKLGCKTTALCCFIVTGLSCISFAGLFAGCKETEYMNVPSVVTVHARGEYKSSTADTCHVSCNCLPYKFDPVCVGGNQSYYSACYAGCLQESPLRNRTYQECTCEGKDSYAVNGGCTKFCSSIYLFVITGIIAMCLLCLTNVPSLNLLLRVVSTEEASLAMGVFQVCLRISFITAPILYGAVIDKTCRLPLVLDDGTFGNCLVYNNYMFRSALAGMTMGLRLLNTLLYFLVFTSISHDM